jgi:alkylation response protein AidB-like acyl-CoA dehydrogenase
VSIAIAEDHLALLATVRRFTADRCPPAVVRAAMDAAPGELPPFWDELAGLGWLGLAVREDHGGEGYGYAELAVVLEELARALAPGSIMPTAWAACLLSTGAGAGDPAVVALVDDLVAGRRVATVALGDPLDAADAGGETLVSGATGPVLCGVGADVAVVACRRPGDDRELWGVVDLSAATVTPLDSLDETRPLARLDVALAPVAVVPLLLREKVEAVGLALAAAECAGGAAWCVDTAAAYARDRRQFGRPIGQFQGVKHRCADMLVALEQARGVAWDAAASLDEERDLRRPATLAAAAAGAVAFDAFVSVAKDCIQVLGGIGFTWEHDAHLYLRRAMALRQLFGGASPWRQATARAALDGTRRALTLDLPSEADALRAEVSATAAAIAALPKEERRRGLVEAGLAVPHWPPPWGRDAGSVEQLVIDEELRGARIRVPHLQVGAWAAPTIVAHGSAEQQERWVGPTLLGDIAWCQLFSEPEAGSDLAALTTRAVPTDGGWLLTGQKVWTTMAAEADWGICLARTNPTAPKHLGITYFVVDMRSPGIDIRPLRELTGLAMFNEVFLDDVFVPDDCVIGEVDGGWPLARTTLANERVSMGSGSSFGGGIEALIGLVAERVADGTLTADALLLDQLGGLVAEAHAVAVMGLRATVRSVTGATPGPEGSVRKLLGVEHDQRTQELGLALLGAEGATTVGVAGQWTFGFLANRCLTIAGGTSEIQRNVIGERLLGLPRDPEPGSVFAENRIPVAGAHRSRGVEGG